MDKTEKISIGHYVFTLDDKAYKVVRDYISTLENHYLKEDDGAEIMENIEERIAELLYEHCGYDGVVSESEVRNVIEILGYPEAESAHTDAEASAEYAKSEKKGKSGVYGQSEKKDETGNTKKLHRLYRDTENKRIAGVCGGLGKYLNVDPVFFRLLFVLSVVPFFFTHFIALRFAGLILYLIMWIVLPKAETAKQRWELRGEDGSIEDLRRRAEYERLHGRGEKNSRQGRGCLLTCIGLLLLILGSFGLIIVVTATIPLIFASGAVRWAVLPFSLFGFLGNGLHSLLNIVFNPWMHSLVVMLFAIPVILMCYVGVLLTFNLESPKWRPGLCMLILWFVLLFIAIPVSYYTTIRNINKLQESMHIEEVFEFSGNLIKDLDKLDEWLDKHNFDTDETKELKEWLEDHNLNEESLPEIREWLERHNFAVPDSMRIEYNDSVFKMDVVDTTITIMSAA